MKRSRRHDPPKGADRTMNPIKRMFSLAGALTALVAIAAVASAGASTDVPYRGTETVVASLEANGDGTFHVTSSGTGVATELGKYTVEQAGSINLVTGSTTGSYTLTAANGDTLSATYTGALTGPTTLHSSGPIVAGTGRFAGATGELVVDGVVVAQTASSATLNNTITGRISTVESS